MRTRSMPEHGGARIKTTDGGQNWKLVKKGMIDDSDVFAIDINADNPDNIIASACSGHLSVVQ